MRRGYGRARRGCLGLDKSVTLCYTGPMVNKKMPGIPEAAQSPDAARAYLEATRWKNGRFCPKCGSLESYAIVARKPGSKTRKGLYKCKACRKQFTVTVGTIFEGSHIPLNKWLLAIHFMTSSKKGMSAHQLHRILGIGYQAAWFMAHRIRYAMKQEPLKSKLQGTIEADETYVGGKEKRIPFAKSKKVPVIALVERPGRVRAFPVERVDEATMRKAMKENVDTLSHLYTDQARVYPPVGKPFEGGHKSVNHSAGEYARGPVHVNTCESFFALLKRGVHGTFHHVSKPHLGRYVDEFAFRWNYRKATDVERATAALAGVEGKRLTYRGPTR